MSGSSALPTAPMTMKKSTMPRMAEFWRYGVNLTSTRPALLPSDAQNIRAASSPSSARAAIASTKLSTTSRSVLMSLKTGDMAMRDVRRTSQRLSLPQQEQQKKPRQRGDEQSQHDGFGVPHE